MKVLAALVVMSVLLAATLSQPAPPPGSTAAQDTSPNFLQMMFLRHWMDMNWPLAMWLSGGMGGGQGGQGGNMFGNMFPWLWLGYN